MEPSNEDNTSPNSRAPRPKSSKPPTTGNRTRGNPAAQRGGSPPQEESVHSVRQSFQTALNKISQQETREIALKELQGVISANNAPAHLRVYFSSLRDPKRQNDSATKEIEVLILGYIASVFKKNLLDPLDKPPELLKAVVRLCEYIHSYFKDTNHGVQIACGKALKEVYSSCIEDESTEIASLIMIEPLYSILNGGADRATQHTAAYCFSEIVKLFQIKNITDLLETSASRFYTIFLKTNHDFPELLESLAIVIFKVGIKGLQGKYTAFTDKLCNIVDSKTVINQYYLTKIEACGALLAFAYALKGADLEQRVVDNLYEKASPILKDASKNKIFKVQQAASEALKFWISLKGGPEAENLKLELPKFAEQAEVERAREDNDKKNEGGKSHNFKEIRSRLKQAKFDDVKQNEAEKRGASVGADASGIDLQNVKYGSQNRGSKFVKSRSGTGGGHVGWNSPEKNTDGKKLAHEKQKKNIKDIIAQKGEGKVRPQSVGPKGGDRFMFIEEKGSQKKQSASKDEDEEDQDYQEERSTTPPKRGYSNKEVIEEEQQEVQQEEAPEQTEEDDGGSKRSHSRQSRKRDSETSQKEIGSSQGLEENDAEEEAPVKFVEKVQKVTLASQMKSESGVSPNKAKPATTTTTSKTTASKSTAAKKILQEEVPVRTNVRKTPEPRNNDIMALEGKLASVIGKSREEVSAEIDQRVEQNRQRKSNPQVPQVQSNDIEEYDAEEGNQATFGQAQGSSSVFTEKVQKRSTQQMSHAGVPKSKQPAAPAKPAATTTTTNTQAQTTTKKTAPKRNDAFFALQGNVANTVPEYNNEQVVPVVAPAQVQTKAQTQQQTTTKKKGQGQAQSQQRYKIADEDAFLLKSIEFMDNTDFQTESNFIDEYDAEAGNQMTFGQAQGFTEKVQKRSTQQRSQAGAPKSKQPAAPAKPAATTTTTDTQAQTSTKKTAPKRNDAFFALQGNMANIIPDYKNEPVAPAPNFVEKVEVNRSAKTVPKVPPKVTKEKRVAYTLVDEDASLFKSIEFMDNIDMTSDFNGIEEYMLDPGQYINQANANDKGEEVNYRAQSQPMPKGRRNERTNAGNEGIQQQNVPIVIEGEISEEAGAEAGFFVEEDMGQGDEGFLGNMAKGIGSGLQKIGNKLGIGGKEEKKPDAEKGKAAEEKQAKNESPEKAVESKEKKEEKVAEEKHEKAPKEKEAQHESPEKAVESKEKKDENVKKEAETKEPPKTVKEEKKVESNPKQNSAQKDEKNPAHEEWMKDKLEGKLKEEKKEEDHEEEPAKKKKNVFGQAGDWLKNKISGPSKDKSTKEERSPSPQKAQEQEEEDHEEDDNTKAKKAGKEDPNAKKGKLQQAGDWMSQKLGLSGKKDKKEEVHEADEEEEEEQKVKEDPKAKKTVRSSSPIKDAGNWITDKLGFSSKKDKKEEAHVDEEEQKVKQEPQPKKGIRSAVPVKDDSDFKSKQAGLGAKNQTVKNPDDSLEDIPNVRGDDDDEEEKENPGEKGPKTLPNAPAQKQEIRPKMEPRKAANTTETPGKSLEEKILMEIGSNMGAYFGKLGGAENASQVEKSVESGNAKMITPADPKREVKAPVYDEKPIKGADFKKQLDEYDEEYADEPEQQIERAPSKGVTKPANNQETGPKSQVRAPAYDDVPIKAVDFKKQLEEYDEEYADDSDYHVEKTPSKEITKPAHIQDSGLRGSDESMERQIMEEIGKSMSFYLNHISKSQGSPENQPKPVGKQDQQGEKFKKVPIERNEKGLHTIKETTHEEDHSEKDQLKDSLMWTKKGREVFEQRIAEEIRRGMTAQGPAQEPVAVNQRSKEIVEQRTAEEMKRGLSDQEKESFGWNQKGREMYEQFIANEIKKGLDASSSKQNSTLDQRNHEIVEQRTAEQMKRGTEHPEKDSYGWNQKGREVFEQRIAEEIRRGMAPQVPAPTQENMGWSQKGREIYEQRIAEEIRRGMAAQIPAPTQENMGWNQKGREMYEQFIANEIKKGLEASSKQTSTVDQRSQGTVEQHSVEQMKRVAEHPTQDSMGWNQKGREIFEQRIAEEIRRGMAPQVPAPTQENMGWNQKGREIYEQRIAEEIRRGMAAQVPAPTQDSMGWNQKGREVFEQRIAEEIRRGMAPQVPASTQENMGWNQKGREVFEQRIVQQMEGGRYANQSTQSNVDSHHTAKFSTLGKGVPQTLNLDDIQDTEVGVGEILEEIDREYQGEDFYNQERGKYYDPDGEFVDSTMDEKSLERYLQNEPRMKQQNKNPSKLTKQVTFEAQSKKSVPETPNFISSKGNFEDTMIYESTEGFPSQLKTSMRHHEKEKDYMGETIVSIEGDNVSSSFKPGKTYPPKKVQESKVENVSAGEMWNKAMEDLGQQNFEAAYSRVLNSGDDIYLLRMLKITGPCLKKLNRATAMKLLKRVIALQKSRFFEKMTLGFFENAHRTQITHNMKIEEQNLLLKALYTMSARSDVVGQTAASLHEAINVDLRTI